MPPMQDRSDPITLGEIERRLAGIEDRMAALESGPHTYCPAPALTERINALETWQKRQNGTLEHILERLETQRTERWEQIEKTRIDLAHQISDVTSQVRALILTALTFIVPVTAGLLYIILNKAL